VRGEPTAALAPRLDAIHSELRSLTKRPPDEMPGLAALANRLDAAEQTLQRIEDVTSRTGTAESSQQQGDLAARTAALEKAVRALHDIAPRLAKLESSASTQARGGETLDARLAAAEAALEQRLGELGRRIDAINDRLADTEQRAVSNERAVDASGAVDRAVRLAVLAAALNAQVERGGPFTLELAAVRPLVADKMQLAPLESVAATGVATAAQLASELASLMPAILSTVAPLSEDDGLLNRLQASAERFVRIRPVTAVAGDDPRSIAARVETKAAQSDIQGALAELAKLPQEGRAPAAEWIKKAEKRVAAIEASRQLAARSVSALVKSAP
jgi:hypothetical protein